MGQLETLFPEQFSGNKEDWKKVLQSELKLPEVEQKLSKNTLEGIFNILSIDNHGQVIPNHTGWKKASQTYFVAGAEAEANMKEDLSNGVRVFFLSEEATLLEKILQEHPDAKDIEVVSIGSNTKAIHSREIFSQGGTHLQEIGHLTTALIDHLQKNTSLKKVEVMISVDNHFFQSIAKIRAFREIAQKIFNELKINPELKIISMVNTREWTLFDRYNNMLRNTSAVASALIGGADLIQSLGYMAPFELETDLKDAEHLKRSRRMSRNTVHILSLESMLGMVQDAAAGSYHLEALTQFYAEGGWKLMQQILPLSIEERESYWSQELKNIQAARLKQFNHRKLVLSGINDYPNVKEVLGLTKLKSGTFRVARGFEELRLRVEKLPHKKNVRIAFWGDYAALNARVNFTKNYFELLGLYVFDPGHSIQTPAEFQNWVSAGSPDEIIVLCAKDEDYPMLKELCAISSTANYVAGKVDLPDHQAIYGGQNIFDVLTTLVKKLESLS